MTKFELRFILNCSEMCDEYSKSTKVFDILSNINLTTHAHNLSSF